jgi:hypothetical protein
VLNVAVSASTSWLEPGRGRDVSNARERVMSASDRERVSIGRARVRAVQRLVIPASANAPSAIIRADLTACIIAGPVAASIESRAKMDAAPARNRSWTA